MAESLVRSVPSLTLDGARLACNAAEAHAKSIGVDVNIAACDASTQLLYFARVGNAKLTSIDIAISKAFTAAGHRNPTAFYQDVVKPDGVAFGLHHTNGGRFNTIAGGLPVFLADGTTCIGGIGASGGSPAQDLAIVEAGIKAFNEVMHKT